MLPPPTPPHPLVILSAVLASGSDVTGVRGQVDSGSAVAEAVGVTAGHVGFSSGKEKASPASRPAHSDPQAPDSESIIVAMERVSVLFDRYTHTHTPSVVQELCQNLLSLICSVRLVLSWIFSFIINLMVAD